MSHIHPTAIVDGSAQLAGDVVIGPWCTVGPGVVLAEGVHLVSHVVVQQDTSVGARTVI
ncbi:MAG: acyl-[acyl-carrier-protein]--UDP-N-acetylglucosamine O-acyltransferase, partial [Brevundimonas sp.]